MSIFDDPTIVPAKALDQPFAGATWLAAMGYPGKDIETRTHRFTHIGKQIVICASVKRQGDEIERVVRELLARRIPLTLIEKALSFSGMALVLATVSECRTLYRTDAPRALFYADNRWAWILSDLKPLRPFPVRGIPGFSKVPRERVEQALKEAAPPGLSCPLVAVMPRGAP